MRTKDIVVVREQAQAAVASMPEGPMKAKAFEVILSKLLDGLGKDPESFKTAKKEATTIKGDLAPRTATERILALRDKGFFREQKSISEVRGELRTHGWHYPLTALSGRLMDLVQRGELRREFVKDGSRKIWKYSNP